METNVALHNTSSSIHPRNHRGPIFFGNGVKKNTAEPWKGKGKLAKAHNRLKARLAQWNAMGADSQKAMKKPGSMK